MSPASASSGDPFDALGDQHRRHILRLLARSDLSVAELARELPISRPAVSRHLRVLKEAGLVGEQPVGTRRIYRLEGEGTVTIERYLRQVWGEAGARFRLAAENIELRGARGVSPGIEHSRGAAMTEPLRFSLDVECPVEHAFRVWTDRINLWWPADHTVSGRSDTIVVFESRLGGRIFERTVEGVEHDWGEVTRWEPPHRLGYLWHLRTDRSAATQVEIQFIVAAEATTRIEIEHAGWERLGGDASQWRDRNRMGWTTLLPHFPAAARLG